MNLEKFLNFLSPLPSPAEIKNWDSVAGEYGLDEFLLMENAGRSALSVLLNYRPNLKNKKIILFMGKGNNGGDAACLARNLIDYGAQCYLFAYKTREQFKGACKRHLELAIDNGVHFFTFNLLENINKKNFLYDIILSSTNSIPDIIVDGLLGTGFKGTLKIELQKLIEEINFYSCQTPECFVLALDIPSGLNPVTGYPSPVAIRANATASFAAIKLGEIFSYARKWTGFLHECNIGIPKKIISNNAPEAWLLDGKALQCIPDPEENSYKNYYGHTVIMGGTRGYSGAAHLAALAALATGSGLVSVVSPAVSAERIKAGFPEVMIYKLGSDGNSFWPDHIEEELEILLQKADSIVVGPGFGRGADSANFLESFFKIPLNKPVVLDADALIIMSKHRTLINYLTGKDIITPHPGEAAALLEIATEDVQMDRKKSLESLCALSDAAVVLKGANTLIGQSALPFFVCPYDIPQMAIGGAGDVLSGCIGSLSGFRQLSQRPAIQLAAMGVIWHALAGLICAQSCHDRGVLASTLAKSLSKVKGHFNCLPPLGSSGKIQPWPQSD